MELPIVPITFSFVGYSHFFPNQIEYAFKLEMNPSLIVIVCPYSLNGGKTFLYRVKTEKEVEIEPSILITPFTPTAFDKGLRELRIRTSSDQEWVAISEIHLQQMTEIYHKTRSD